MSGAACGADGLDVPVVGTAAATENGYLRVPAAKVAILAAEFDRISRVEILSLV